MTTRPTPVTPAVEAAGSRGRSTIAARRAAGMLAAVAGLVAASAACVVPPGPGGGGTTTTTAPPGPAPGTPIPLNVREVAGVARTGEVLTSGVPIPRSLDLRTTAGLRVTSGSQTVPAQFEVLARWDAAVNDASAPIQWLLVSFPATVGASATAAYELRTVGGPGPSAPATPVSVAQSGSTVTVSTGAATFVIGGTTGLFDQVRNANGTIVATGGASTATIGGTNAPMAAGATVRIERSTPMAAVIVVDGAFTRAAVGNGGYTVQRRYELTAGSPTAMVRQSIQWEGDLCGAGVIACNGAPNGVLLGRERDTITLADAGPMTATVVGARGSAALSGSATTSQTASVAQVRRASRTAPRSFTAAVTGATTSGVAADGGVLAVNGPNGGVALALDHMDEYEPQALRLLTGHTLAADLVAEDTWLGARQGTYAQLAVSALLPSTPAATIDRQVWAPRNHPLRAWPSPSWFAGSGAVDGFPAGTLPAGFADYDTHLQATLDLTETDVNTLGTNGVMTYGSFPRTWGTVILGDELDCGNDPTPATTWDNTYWCAAWTDYHNASMTASVWAMRTGDVRRLDEIATPAALRSQFTQVMRCAPTDTWFYCGQAPAGYGGFRADFNSSHAYFDNLMFRFWVTGDRTIVDTLQRGASTMRSYLCPRRPAAPCTDADPQPDPWAGLSGRVAYQWLSVFRFVGLASTDATYLADWHSLSSAAVTRHYVEASSGGVAYGFWTGATVSGAGTFPTDQLWMASLYDMRNIERLRIDTDDAPLGTPAVRPSRILTSWARTLHRYAATAVGDGTATGQWPNGLTFSFTGSRVGGTLTSVTADLGGSDPYLYGGGKSNLAAVMTRAGLLTGDTSLTTMGRDLARVGLDSAEAEGGPLAKGQSLYLQRLHPALAVL